MDETDFGDIILNVMAQLDEEVDDDALKNVLAVELMSEVMKSVYENDDEQRDDEVLLYYE